MKKQWNEKDLNIDSEKPRRFSDLLGALREFKGITRKAVLGDLLSILEENAYDDAGVLDIDHIKVVVSADGIVEGLVKDDPWLAGFYSVVVNVNDVVAKGAKPLGYVYVLSSSSSSMRRQIAKGVRYGIEKYGLKFLKGHTHPDTSYEAVDAAVIGVAHNIITSTAAKPGDSLIVAVDLDGTPGLKSWVKTFDSVLLKTRKQVLTRLEAIIRLSEKKLVHACRDISGPGVVGTILMLCESSHVGASIIIDDIPKPKKLGTQEWLLTYPSTGFVLTTNRPQDCVQLLSKHGLTAKVAGTITKRRIVQISYQDQTGTIMNLTEQSIFGVDKREKRGRVDAEEIEVKELPQTDVAEIEALLNKVWATAYEYPEEWRRNRILTKEQILKEMKSGYHYFGIRVGGGKLAGLYKAFVTKEGLFGEHQTVDPDHRAFGLATAMYHQFIRFAKENNCKKVYVNILANQIASRRILEKMGFHKKGREYEQAKGMKVQMYQHHV